MDEKLTELEELRLYLRLDEIESDELEALLDTAKDFIKTSTGKEYDSNNSLMRLCAKILAAHWYQERGLYSKSGYQEYAYSATTLLQQIASQPSENQEEMQND